VRAPVDASTLLRAGLLEGVSIVCAGARGARSQFALEAERACGGLGADVRAWAPAGEHAAGGAGEETPELDVLCVDAAGAFGAASPDAREALDRCLELAWEATRALVAEKVAERARAARARRIIYIAPASSAGLHAQAACAGLENLARTLSIEWARFAVSTVAIAPGADTSAAEIGALVAYLSSAAAGYFSGCLLDLTGPAVSSVRE
jgi:NAD(P)-dependent dehydrogenase (short-subunit alcohol dehydrogenase family)